MFAKLVAFQMPSTEAGETSTTEESSGAERLESKDDVIDAATSDRSDALTVRLPCKPVSDVATRLHQHLNQLLVSAIPYLGPQSLRPSTHNIHQSMFALEYFIDHCYFDPRRACLGA